jgi:hypothetical protein
MDISILLIRFVFLALPGILGNRLYRTLTGKPAQKDWEDFLDIAIFSLISYSAYGLILEFFSSLGYQIGNLTVLQAALDDKSPLVWSDIYMSTLFGLLSAIIAAYLHKYKVVNGFGRLIGASIKYGDPTVWDIFHRKFSGRWILIKDHKVDLTYYGIISTHSTSNESMEIIMRAVDVFDTETGGKLYSADVVYISRDNNDITIEIPDKEFIGKFSLNSSPNGNSEQQIPMISQEEAVNERL